MSDLQSEMAVLKAHIIITRKDTGVEEHYDIVGTAVDETPAEVPAEPTGE